MRSIIAAALLSIVCGSGVARAAEITVGPGPDATSALILVSGPIVPQDWPKFLAATKNVPEATASVMLQSNGGNVLAAIRMGNLVRQKRWVTMVWKDHDCASACGLIWLAGRARFLDYNARVGFHAAFEMHGEDSVEKGDINAIMGAYLSRLGLSYEAIAYLTSASPTNMTWLNKRDAAGYGIDFEQIGPHVQPAQSGSPVPLPATAPPPIPLTSTIPPGGDPIWPMLGRAVTHPHPPAQ